MLIFLSNCYNYNKKNLSWQVWWVTNRTCRWENSKGLSSKKIPSSVPRLPPSDQWVSMANKIIPFHPKIWKLFPPLWSIKEIQTVNNFIRKTRRNSQCWHFWKIKDNFHEEFFSSWIFTLNWLLFIIFSFQSFLQVKPKVLVWYLGMK